MLERGAGAPEKLTTVNFEASSMAGDLAKAMNAPFANRRLLAFDRTDQTANGDRDRSRADRSVTYLRSPTVALEALQDRAVEALDVVNGEIEQLMRNA